jgi:hypothetical protein
MAAILRCPTCGAVVPIVSHPLQSWKEIAAYVGRGVRTVQRWEHDLGLPVHRPQGKDHSAVLAFPEEISSWMHCTPQRSSGDFAVPAPREPQFIS